MKRQHSLALPALLAHAACRLTCTTARPLACTALALGAHAALAQGAVTLYGVADVGFVRESGGPGGSANKLTGGVASGSRLGLRGTEDLGGGLAAHFTLEMGINMDNGSLAQGGLAFGRQSFVGLSGPLGNLTLGRQYTPAALAQFEVDPFLTGLAGTSGNLMSPGGAGGSNRMDNALKYALPGGLGGFNGEVVYGFGEAAGNSTANRQWGGFVGYAAGPLSVKLAHHDTKDATSRSGKVTWLTGKYDFGKATGYLARASNRNSQVFGQLNADSTDWLVAVSVPAAGGQVLASYIRKNDHTAANQDARQWALAYLHPLSRRTTLYTAIARIDNKAPNTSATGFYRVGNATEAGTGDRAFNLGVRHVF